MNRILIYSAAWCGYCRAAKRFLDEAGLVYDEIDLGDDPAFRQKVFDATGGWTLPQIVIDGTPIGGYSELVREDPDRLASLATASSAAPPAAF